MRGLPDEIWTNIFDYLDPLDIVSCQLVSRRVLKLARDTSLWRTKVFERAPSATHSLASSSNALSALTGALGGLSLRSADSSDNSTTASEPITFGSVATELRTHPRISQRARAVLRWDCTDINESIDWYSEYIARHAPLSTIWSENGPTSSEVRGMAVFGQQDKVISNLEDGSLAVWDIQQSSTGRRNLKHLGKSRSGLLFEDMYSLGESSLNKKIRPTSAAVDNISIDSRRMRAFVAVENMLNEVDLEKMEVISQTKFAWPITALSQEGQVGLDLTVGTSFSLHIHDPRLLCSNPTDDSTKLDDSQDSRTAFLQNYNKHIDLRQPDVAESDPSNFSRFLFNSHFQNRAFESFARIEPGPQSILHRGEREIIIAGRMPSILFYDRRNFPTPRTGIHSGARLSAMTMLPVPPKGADKSLGSDSTLIACGEYSGRGSLELYELPWQSKASFEKAEPARDAVEPLQSYQKCFSFKNRQVASSSKILSVVTQGTRIVFSDSEGKIKWVERDGHGLARRWNINAFEVNKRGASISGDKVVRKMIALPEELSERGHRGDGDLLVWTGENIGIVTTKPKPWDDHDDLVKAFERGMSLDEKETGDQEKEAQYSTMMRQALERQADERRYMSRFGMRRW